MLGLTSVEEKLRVGHQRCAQTSGSHIPHPKIAHHRAAEGFRQIGGVPHLQGAPKGGVQIGHFLRDVVHRLSVGADEVDLLYPGLLQKGLHRLGIKPTQMGVHEAKFPTAPRLPTAQCQNPFPGGRVKGLKRKAQLLHLCVGSAACDAGEYSVDAVGGGAAHQPHHQSGLRFPKCRHGMLHGDSPFFPVYLLMKTMSRRYVLWFYSVRIGRRSLLRSLRDG